MIHHERRIVTDKRTGNDMSRRRTRIRVYQGFNGENVESGRVCELLVHCDGVHLVVGVVREATGGVSFAVGDEPALVDEVVAERRQPRKRDLEGARLLGRENSTPDQLLGFGAVQGAVVDLVNGYRGYPLAVGDGSEKLTGSRGKALAVNRDKRVFVVVVVGGLDTAHGLFAGHGAGHVGAL